MVEIHILRFVVGKSRFECCYYILGYLLGGTAVEQWLRCCATNRKVAGSIPAGVNGIFQ